MLNIYDIEVNFNEHLYDFFDWKIYDNVEIIRKIPIIRVSNIEYNLVIEKGLKIKNDLLSSIYNKTEIYNERKYNKISYACIITNTKESVGVIFKENGYISKLSRFALEDEIEILDISLSLKKYKFEYDLIKTNRVYNYYLRMEQEIIDKILFELKKYKDDDQKLKYLYFEWFNKKYSNKKDYLTLTKDIKCKFTNKHYEFLEILKLFVV